jgi:hypothetical protein
MEIGFSASGWANASMRSPVRAAKRTPGSSTCTATRSLRVSHREQYVLRATGALEMPNEDDSDHDGMGVWESLPSSARVR